MTWFKVDDSFAFHRKAVAAGNAACGLWVRAGAWASQQLSDGHVPDDVLKAMGTKGQVNSLISVGLWLPGDGGVEFHQWAGRNPSREQVEERRAKDAERLARWREEQKRKGNDP